jgi:hypothetical protein
MEENRDPPPPYSFVNIYVEYSTPPAIPPVIEPHPDDVISGSGAPERNDVPQHVETADEEYLSDFAIFRFLEEQSQEFEAQRDNGGARVSQVYTPNDGYGPDIEARYGVQASEPGDKTFELEEGGE